MSPIPDQTQSLRRQTALGANWIYWIAGLSAVNVIVAFTGSGWGFYITMIAPLAVASTAHGSSVSAKIVLGAIALALCGIYAVFGLFAHKGARWAFVVAMIVYFLDALGWLGVKEWIGVAFHAYALWRMAIGAQAAFAMAKRRKASGSASGYQGVRGDAPPFAGGMPPPIYPPPPATPGQPGAAIGPSRTEPPPSPPQPPAEPSQD